MSEQGNERSMQVYDVALWYVWPSLFPDNVGYIESNGTYAAVMLFMERCRVEKVAYATARLVGHPRIDRWQRLYFPLTVQKRGRKW